MKFLYIKRLVFLIFFLSFQIKAQDADEFIQKAKEKVEQNEFHHALSLIDRAIKIDRLNFEYYIFKAEVLNKANGPMEAIMIVNQAFELDDENPDLYYTAGVLFETAKSFDAAVDMYSEAIFFAKNDSSKYAYTMKRAIANTSKKDYKSAIEDFESVLKFKNNDLSILNNIAICYNELNDVEQSLNTLKRIIAVDSAYVAPFVNIGYLYITVEKYDSAVFYLDKAIGMDSSSILAFSNRGLAFYKLGNNESAKNDLNKAIELNPSNSLNYKVLGEVLIGLKEKELACKQFDIAKEKGYEATYGEGLEDLIFENCLSRKEKKRIKKAEKNKGKN